MKDANWKEQDVCKGLAAQAVMAANNVYGETGAAALDQGSLATWRRIKVALQNVVDALNDLENNLTTITGGL
jgi:hypothetical protein